MKRSQMLFISLACALSIGACSQHQKQQPPAGEQQQPESTAPTGTEQPRHRDEDPTPLAPGQGAPAGEGERPNIVVIWGDDIGQSNLSVYSRGVGTILEKLDELGIADDTIVFDSTDNGPHMNTWPDAGMTPFRNEKNSNWEGAFRVPAMVRWPDHIQPGTVTNAIMSHMDWFPTLLAAAGDPEVKDSLARGTRAIGRDYEVHLDGYDFLPYLTGQTDWLLDRAFILVPAQVKVAEFLRTFEEYPPRQRAASFTVDQALERMQASFGS